MSENPPYPDVLVQEIVEDLEAALEQFREIATDLVANKNEEWTQEYDNSFRTIEGALD